MPFTPPTNWRSQEFKPPASLVEYEGYSRLNEVYGLDSPQVQGMTYPEYLRALDDSRVVSTVIHTGDSDFRFPQLSPIERYDWLNADYYARTFPEEATHDRLLHFIQMPSIEPGEDVKDRLRRLGNEHGVLAFDFPSSDGEYPNRIEELLGSLGVGMSEPQHLGTQTYFAGQSKFKIPIVAGAPRLSFEEAWDRLLADGEYDPALIENGASLKSSIPHDQAQVMKRFYDEAYKVLNDDPCNQGLDADQFYDMVTDDLEHSTNIVNSVDGEAVALCILHNKLDSLSWVNAEYYRNHYPGLMEGGQVVWSPGLASDPEKLSGPKLIGMAKLITKLAVKANNELLLVFDCCKKNTGKLDKVLNSVLNLTGVVGIDIREIASQQYMAVKTLPKQ
jgi:hypothetical protein